MRKNPFGNLYDPTRGFAGYIDFGGGQQQMSTQEQQCVAQGGVWDPVNMMCRLPSGDGQAVPTNPYDKQAAQHAKIDKAFSDYGKQITAGTARPEDNPAYNAGLAEANKQFAGLTSADFNNPNLTEQQQRAMAGQSMAAAGISNVGGKYNQDASKVEIAIQTALLKLTAVFGSLGKAVKALKSKSNGNPVFNQQVDKAAATIVDAGSSTDGGKSQAALDTLVNDYASANKDNDNSMSHDEIIAKHKAIAEASKAAQQNSTQVTDSYRGGRDSDGWGENDGGYIGRMHQMYPRGYNRGGHVARYNDGGELLNHPFEREGAHFDTVEANLTPGEFVIDADSTHVFQPILEKINEWEPGDDPKLGGLLSRKGEKMTITKDLGNGRKMSVTSGEDDEMLMDDAEKMLSTETKPTVAMNIGGLLGGIGKSIAKNVASQFSPQGQMYNRQRQNALAARNAERAGAGISGGLMSLGRGVDAQQSQLRGAGLRTTSSGGWGSGGYSPAQFAQNAAGETDFSGQAQAIGQGAQEVGNAEANYQGSLANIDRQKFQDEVAAQTRQDNIDRQNRNDFEKAVGEYRDKISELESGNAVLQNTIQQGQRFVEIVASVSAESWNEFYKASTVESVSGWWDRLMNAGEGADVSTEALLQLLEERGLNAVTDSAEQGKITSAIGALADLATAALKAQGPGVKTNFDFKVAKDTIAQINRPQQSVIASGEEFIRRISKQIEFNNKEMDRLETKMDQVAGQFGFSPENTDTAPTDTTTPGPENNPVMNKGGLLSR